MGHPAKTLFVLADGARARLVERSAKSGDFVTIDEIDARDRLRQLRRELRASPQARTHQSTEPRRHKVGREGYLRRAKEEFVAEVAERANALRRKGDYNEVFLAAPARLIGPLRAQFGADAPVAGALERDLTKAPDSALSHWLGGGDAPEHRF